MAYGDLKVNNLIYDTGSGDTTKSVVSIPSTASPTFTGTVTVPTPTAGDDSTKAATTAFVVASFATKASPTFTGTVTVPTATAGDNSTVAASTAFVVASFANLASPTFTGTPTLPTGTVAVTQSAGNSTTAIATTAFVATSFAPLASPTLTGTPAAPTASANTNTTQIATTAFVMTELGDYATLAAPAFTGTATGVNLTLSGNLTVNGTTTTIDTTTLDVEDKNITIGKVSTPSDTTADGGGITLKGATDKTWNWVDANDAWTSSEHIHLGDAKKLYLGTGKDLQIFFNGTSSNILTDSQNDLYIGHSSETLAAFKADGAVDLYHDNSKKFETTAAGATVTGTLTSTSISTGDVDFNGSLIEKCKVTAGKLSDNTNINIEDGHVCLFTTTESTTSTPNIRYSASATLDSKMAVGDSIAVVLITTSHASGYSAQLNIDGAGVTEEWNGGAAPSAGTGSGLDVYSYTIIKTASNTYTVLAGMVNFA